jgi:hypothetical protein
MRRMRRMMWRRRFSAFVLTGLILAVSISPVSACAESKADTAIRIKIGRKSYTAVLGKNKAAKALFKKLPARFTMSELNGNEKYKYLNYDLPVKAKKVRQIKAGDIMLYGSDCLVLFYKSFRTNYSYTRIGHIKNPKVLKKAVGKGKISVTLREQTYVLHC